MQILEILVQEAWEMDPEIVYFYQAPLVTLRQEASKPLLKVTTVSTTIALGKGSKKSSRSTS